MGFVKAEASRACAGKSRNFASVRLSDQGFDGCDFRHDLGCWLLQIVSLLLKQAEDGVVRRETVLRVVALLCGAAMFALGPEWRCGQFREHALCFVVRDGCAGVNEYDAVFGCC